MTRQAVGGCAIFVLLAATTSAQVPAGGEFIVNSYTTGPQAFPNLASAKDGSLVAVWMDNGGHDGSGSGVFGQVFDAAGTRRGGEFQVNTYTTGNQTQIERPGVAMDAKGNFVVVWASLGQDGSGWGVFGQRHAASGSRLGSEFQVNTYTTGNQGFFGGRTDGKVAMAPGGAFVVVWSSAQDGDFSSVHGQRFDAAGVKAGAEFQVNSYTTGYQVQPVVSADRAGNFVVAWTNQDLSSAIWTSAQRYDGAGNALGSQFDVSTDTGAQGWITHSAGLGHADDGSFVVSWDADNQDGSGWNVAARRFDAAGTALGAQMRVNTYTTGVQRLSALAVDGFGNFVVAYHDYGRTPDSNVFAQRVDAAGNFRGSEFQVNTWTTLGQGNPTLASDSAGNFVIAWQSTFQDDGNAAAVVGRRYGGLLPQALRVDVAGNQVWEPGESVEVRPAWRNANGAAQTFSGTLSSLAGPGGNVYAIVDSTASYGTVADGANGDCTGTADCYVVLNAISPRPVLHVDASAVESLAPDAQGQRKRWLLHVGRSFTDVPSTSGFYRFVETLLHHSVTGGCGPDIYCPASTTSRDQMAVFVLVGKEGSGYVPPACGATPMFADVPASSPFCRWIEELARRGVVGGCGGGNYCPALPATREQMSVFVLRTLDPALNPPACGTPVFADVPASSPFCRWVEELARRGVVSGCGGPNYCPTGPVTREQMSVFISVTFGLTLYGV